MYTHTNTATYTHTHTHPYTHTHIHTHKHTILVHMQNYFVILHTLNIFISHVVTLAVRESERRGETVGPGITSFKFSMNIMVTVL